MKFGCKIFFIKLFLNICKFKEEIYNGTNFESMTKIKTKQKLALFFDILNCATIDNRI